MSIRVFRRTANQWNLVAGIVLAGTCLAQVDPGPRGGPAGAGSPIAGLTVKEGKFFSDGQSRFAEVDTTATGLGPRFNMNSCAGCHAQPASGGSSPATNPQVAVAPGAVRKRERVHSRERSSARGSFLGWWRA
jgi:hypothetical protein